MKRYIFLSLAILLSIFSFGVGNVSAQDSKNVIKVETPARPDGQKDVIGLTCAPIPVVRIGFIGLGDRGNEAVRRFVYQTGIEIKGLCDLHKERVDSCQAMLKRAHFLKATAYFGSEDA